VAVGDLLPVGTVVIRFAGQHHAVVSTQHRQGVAPRGGAQFGSVGRYDIQPRVGIGGGDFGSALSAALDERLIDYFDAVRRGSDVTEIFDRFNAFRVLCAHRAGRTGVLTVNRRIEDALEAKHGIATGQTWYAGRPVMITRNDYNVRLFNGDVGIALADPEGVAAYLMARDLVGA
jgi:exodeoxyribonuclease V alpha subunit